MKNESGAPKCANGSCGCEHGNGPTLIDRRTMLSQAVLLSAAAALAACGTGFGDPTAPANVTFTMKISDYPALASVGGVTAVNASGSPLAVVRTGAETFIALSRICPHQGSTIGIFTNGFQCPRHGATFNATGGWIGGQPTSNMHSYAATYTAATDTLQIG